MSNNFPPKTNYTQQIQKTTVLRDVQLVSPHLSCKTIKAHTQRVVMLTL